MTATPLLGRDWPAATPIRRSPPTLPSAPIGWRIGCDLVDVARLHDRLRRTPGLRARLFLDAEQEDAVRGGVAPGSVREAERLAARFAAKEAAYKAFGLAGLRFLDVQVVVAADGAPHLRLHGRTTPATVSLSHDAGLAMAVVLAPTTDHWMTDV